MAILKKKKETINVACIVWEDATMICTEQLHPDSEQIELSKGFSCGVVVKEDKKMIALAQDYFVTKTVSSHPYRSVCVYPKSGVLTIHRFKFNVKRIKYMT